MTATPLGHPIPQGELHAVSVSLPKWEDVCGYERGESRVVDKMQIGYPRFFVNKLIQRLAEFCISKYGDSKTAEHCYLFPTLKIAQCCQDFLKDKSPPVPSRIVAIHSPDEEGKPLIFAVFMHLDHASFGKEFWQHTGDGISSRRAQQCLAILCPEHHDSPSSSSINGSRPSARGFGRNRHYSRKSSTDANIDLSSSITSLTESVHSLSTEAEDKGIEERYVEERYGRNLARTLGPFAKNALKRRIAGVIKESTACSEQATNGDLSLAHEKAALQVSGGSQFLREQESFRGLNALSEDDVFLYPTGMSAIFHAHQTCLSHARRKKVAAGKSICFGFPYTDTLKILQKWGPGAHHFGNGLDHELEDIERLLQATCSSGEPRILSLFTEFPSNPLLRSVDLQKLRALADKYDFLIVVDETIGTFANVDTLPWADIVVSSLTKIFSGDCNVMGGSLLLNPNGKHYKALKEILEDEHEDTVLDEDALFLERNSRNYRQRRWETDSNAEKVCDYLHSRLKHQTVLTAVLYPKYNLSDIYRKFMRPKNLDPTPGFTSLFSLVFSSSKASEAFFDALPCEKGPSLGTSFTLACPYTILAHWNEVDWAEGWGVSKNLVRVSIGQEDTQTLLRWFELALDAAIKASPV